MNREQSDKAMQDAAPGLVSILTPMYNTGKYVHRLLDSVLAQDYPRIEMIVVDDGSTDGSRKVVEGYMDRFSERGYVLRYVYQANSGQSVAIRNGLPLVSGEYLSWPDSDDFYAADDAISKMVGALESSSGEFQMVRTQVTYVEDGTLRPFRVDGLQAKEEEGKSLFEDCLLAKNGFFYCAGSYLVRTAVLKEVTGFDIYTEKNAGQNWQLLLPILYHYRCKTILEPLYTVVERGASHTRGQYSGFDRSLAIFDAYVHSQTETLKRIKGFPEELIPVYSEQILEHNRRRMYHMALRENRRRVALDCLPACKSELSKGEYKAAGFLLKLPGGTYLTKAYIWIHHILHVWKKRIMSVFAHHGK